MLSGETLKVKCRRTADIWGYSEQKVLLWANLVFSCCSGIGFPSLAPLGWWFCAVSCPSLGQAGDLNSSGWVKLEAKFNVVSDGLKRNKGIKCSSLQDHRVGEGQADLGI